jgi:predicted metal-binding membrane protein
MSAAVLRSRSRVTPAVVGAVLIGAALVGWIVLYLQMQGMDIGPGTDLGALGWWTGIWATMTAAMMLPSAAPMVLFFARIAGERARRGQAYVSTWFFVAGYLVVWTAVGLVAFGLYRAIAGIAPGFLAWNAQGPVVAGLAIAAAGVYQLTPLKRLCLHQCRSPLSFVLHSWRDGRRGALRMGMVHGAYCVGCCWGLMLILFVLGVMSLLWMAVVAAVIFAEKVLPQTRLFIPAVAVVAVAVGVWVAVSPGSLPGLA